MIGKERERKRDTPCVFVSFFFYSRICGILRLTESEEEREDMCLDFLYERGVEGDMYIRFRARKNAREGGSLSLKAPAS
jgi:hypothetical protein